MTEECLGRVRRFCPSTGHRLMKEPRLVCSIASTQLEQACIWPAPACPVLMDQTSRHLAQQLERHRNSY